MSDSDRNKEDIFSLNQKNLKNDILHFKDDILKDLKAIQKNISEKFEISNNVIKEKLEAYEFSFQNVHEIFYQREENEERNILYVL